MIKKPKLEIAIIITFITVFILYGFGIRLVFKGVQQYATEAQSVYGGDAVGSLIALAEDENASFEKRNSAIWALGQLGNERALPTLVKLDYPTDQEPPYDSTAYILEYGVKKSIRQIRGFSSTRWIYRFL
jgi:hypothetical protein